MSRRSKRFNFTSPEHYDSLREYVEKEFRHVTEYFERRLREVEEAAGGGSGDSSDSDAIQALSDKLEEHIAADVVHGVNTPVVGEDDRQDLEQKQIGQARPRRGKFTILEHTISWGQLVLAFPGTTIIPSGSYAIVADGFTVAGSHELKVEGTLVVV